MFLSKEGREEEVWGLNWSLVPVQEHQPLSPITPMSPVCSCGSWWDVSLPSGAKGGGMPSQEVQYLKLLVEQQASAVSLH